MYPTIQTPLQQFQSYKLNHRLNSHHHNNNAIPIPYVKLSQIDAPGSVGPYGMRISQVEQQSTQIPFGPPATIAATAVRFVPCFCGNNDEERRGYTKTNVQYTGTGYQPVHLLPCYCVLRDAEAQYGQPSPIPSSTSEPMVRDFSASTASPK